MNLHRSLCLISALSFLAVTSPNIHAQPSAGNPTGTWKLTQAPKSTFEPTLKLKLDGDKLTGTLTRNTGSKIEELAIEDGKFKGNEVLFATHFYSHVYDKGALQPASTNYMSHWKFQGTLSGDTIKGKVEKTSSAGVRTQDWEAKRLAK